MKTNNRIEPHPLAEVARVWVALLLLATTLNLQAQYNYTTLAVPGAVDTEAYGISGNHIVGSYYNGTTQEGFLYNGSTYTTLSVPGAEDTYAYGIDGTNVVGYYETTNAQYGFLYNGNAYTTLSVPGATNTFAYGISGTDIVGIYANSNGYISGFIYHGGIYTTLNVPGANDTWAYGISGGEIVGYYSNGGSYQGFLYNGSTYTTLSVPGAEGMGTMAYGISGTNVVGAFDNVSGGGFQGFTYNGSSYATLSVPGEVQAWAYGISGNDIVGTYEGYEDGYRDFGFLATPASPAVSIQPQTLAVTVGNPASFTLTTYGSLPLSYQWLFNGTNILNATNSAFVLNNAFPVNAGLYAVIATNVYGSVTSAPAILTVSPLVLTAPQSPANGQFQFSFNTATGVDYTIQYSLTLTDWLPLVTFKGNGGPITIIDPNAAGSGQRFYRVELSQ